MTGWRDLVLCGLFRTLLALDPIWVVQAALAAPILGALIARFSSGAPQARTKRGSASPGPAWVAASLLALATYLLARLLDPLLAARLERPAHIEPERWARIGFFEWRLLGSPWLQPLLPIGEHWSVAAALHLLGWGLFVVLARAAIASIVRRTVPGGLTYFTAERDRPFFYRWVGASTARGADARFRVALRPVVAVAVLLDVVSGAIAVETASPPGLPSLRCGGAVERAPADAGVWNPELGTPRAESIPVPAPGSWALCTIVLAALAFHLNARGRAPAEKEQTTTREDSQAPATASPAASALERLASALNDPELPGRLRRTREEARPEERMPVPEEASVPARELLSLLTGEETLWSHQREVLDHLARSWRTSPARFPERSPSFKEESLATPFTTASELTHPLLLVAEGAGRTTFTIFAALSVALDRGAASILVVRDREAARAMAERTRGALQRSSLRWNVPVAVAGEDLGRMLLAQRPPALVVSDLENFEAEVLSDPRTDPIFQRLGLIAIDDLDAFFGVPEMHLQLAMRRAWVLLDTLHAAAYPPLLLATAGPSATGLHGWARAVLGAPLRLFDRNGAPRPARTIVRLRELGTAGRGPSLVEIAAACARAAIPWHHRLAGDAQRKISRAKIDLAHLPGHVTDPLDAEVVLIEGRYGDVQCEAARLVHAGRRAAKDREVLVVLASPVEDELVLDEEADDGPVRALAASLPRAVLLSEPEGVRQRHFDRLLGRELDVDALRARFGAAFVDETLERLEAKGRIARRTVLVLDPHTGDARPKVRVRSIGEAAIGEPIAAGCVGESTSRVALVDEATGMKLCEVDRAIAIALYPPGRLWLDPNGRYVVREPTSDGRTLPATHGQAPGRTTPVRDVAISVVGSVPWSTRSLGGLPVPSALARVDIVETFHGVRRYVGEPTDSASVRPPVADDALGLVERRSFPAPLATSYSTEACLIAFEPALPRGAEIALAAAVRMMLPCLVRAGEGLVDADITTITGMRCLAIFDRTLGASGIARQLHREHLRDLLRLARAALERLVGAEANRLRAFYDTSVDGDRIEFLRREALVWLDRTLDRSFDRSPDGASETARLGFEPGEGNPGDLGRIWITPNGRTDELVWTRHAWTSEVPLGGCPPGPVHLDIAFERSAIARALAFPVADSVEAWSEAIAVAERDLAPLAAHLAELAGDAYSEAVLGLVAAIPLRPNPLPPAERAPLLVLSRRRADARAKTLLAYVLLRAGGTPAVLEGPHGPFLCATIRGRERCFDFGVSPPRIADDNEIAAARRVLA